MKKALAFTALALAFLFVTGFQTTSQLASQLTSIQFQLVNLKTQISGLEAQVTSLEANNKGPRKFYLTQTTHNGANALSACASGYHMASMSEIVDPSNLRYDTDLGRTNDDSGFGPPNMHLGWIRTGNPPNSLFFPVGSVNCNAWTSAFVGDGGTAVSLLLEWNGAGTPTSPWHAVSINCSNTPNVWCVQD